MEQLIKKFEYKDKVFTTIEEIYDYDNQVYQTWREAGYTKGTEKEEFEEAFNHYMLDILRSIIFDPKQDFDTNEEANAAYEDSIYLGCQFLKLASELGFWDYGEQEQDSVDLDDQFVDITYYFKDYKEDNLYFAFSGRETPWTSYDEHDYTFWAAKRVPVTTYEYVSYDK
jgi:hypothetical protein